MKHYKFLAVENDRLHNVWLCGGGKCRDHGGCEVIEFWHGMSDFANYKVDGEDQVLLEAKGTLVWPENFAVPGTLPTYDARLSYANPSFTIDENGKDVFTVATEAEGLSLYVNNLWFADIKFTGWLAKVFAVKTLATDEEFEKLGLDAGHCGVDIGYDEGAAGWIIEAEADLTEDKAFAQALKDLQWAYSGSFKNEQVFQDLAATFD